MKRKLTINLLLALALLLIPEAVLRFYGQAYLADLSFSPDVKPFTALKKNDNTVIILGNSQVMAPSINAQVLQEGFSQDGKTAQVLNLASVGTWSLAGLKALEANEIYPRVLILNHSISVTSSDWAFQASQLQVEWQKSLDAVTQGEVPVADVSPQEKIERVLQHYFRKISYAANFRLPMSLLVVSLTALPSVRSHREFLYSLNINPYFRWEQVSDRYGHGTGARYDPSYFSEGQAVIYRKTAGFFGQVRTPDDVWANYETILKKFLARDTRVIFVLTPIGAEHYAKFYVQSGETARLSQLTGALGIPVVDLNDAKYRDRGWLSFDGVHVDYPVGVEITREIWAELGGL